jgi:hypothetical protein
MMRTASRSTMLRSASAWPVRSSPTLILHEVGTLDPNYSQFGVVMDREAFEVGSDGRCVCLFWRQHLGIVG